MVGHAGVRGTRAGSELAVEDLHEALLERARDRATLRLGRGRRVVEDRLLGPRGRRRGGRAELLRQRGERDGDGGREAPARELACAGQQGGGN